MSNKQLSSRSDRWEWPDRPQCAYYDPYGNLGNRRVTLHPELSEPGWLPTGSMQRVVFLNRAKATVGARTSGSGNSA